jgi:homoserine dehydrogenase
VVADIVDVARVLGSNAASHVPALAFQAESVADIPIVPIADTESGYYLRIPALDRPGVLAQIARILSEEGISIEAVIQKEQAIRNDDGENWVPVIILTQRVRERNVDRAVAGIQELEDIRGSITRLRVETLR